MSATSTNGLRRRNGKRVPLKISHGAYKRTADRTRQAIGSLPKFHGWRNFYFMWRGACKLAAKTARFTPPYSIRVSAVPFCLKKYFYFTFFS